MMLRKAVFFLGAMALGVSCGGDSNSGSEGKDYEGKALFSASSSAIKSSMDTDAGKALSQVSNFAPARASMLEDKSSMQDFTCDEYGGVKLAGGGEPDLSTMRNYAAANFYCTATVAPEVPTTALGALRQSSNVLCSIGELVADGQEHEYEADMNGCFSQEFIDDVFGGANTFSGTYRVNELSGSDWDKEIEFTTEFGISYGRFKFRDSNGVKAIAYVGQQSAEVTAYTVVMSSNKLIFEMKYFKDGKCENAGMCNDHKRIMIEGNFNSDGVSFDSISKIEGIMANYNVNAGDNDYGHSQVVTIKSVGAGMRTQQNHVTGGSAGLEDIDVVSNWTTDNPEPCFPAGADCGTDYGFEFNQNTDYQNFLTDSVDVGHAKTWYDGMTSPLDFASVTTQSIQ